MALFTSRPCFFGRTGPPILCLLLLVVGIALAMAEAETVTCTKDTDCKTLPPDQRGYCEDGQCKYDNGLLGNAPDFEADAASAANSRFAVDALKTGMVLLPILAAYLPILMR